MIAPQISIGPVDATTSLASLRRLLGPMTDTVLAAVHARYTARPELPIVGSPDRARALDALYLKAVCSAVARGDAVTAGVVAAAYAVHQVAP